MTTPDPTTAVTCPGCGTLHRSGHEDTCACDHCGAIVLPTSDEQPATAVVPMVPVTADALRQWLSAFERVNGVFDLDVRPGNYLRQDVTTAMADLTDYLKLVS